MRRGAILQSLRTLVAALALGVLVWYIARNEITGEEQVEVPIRVVAAGDCRVTAKNGGPPRVNVMLAGPMLPLQHARDDIRQDKEFARLELSSEHVGELRIPTDELELKSLSDRRIRLRVVDREVRLVVTPLARLTLPVKVVTDLDPLRYSVQTTPRHVIVHGPKALLDGLTELKTEPLKLREIADAGKQPSWLGYVDIVTVLQGQRIECNEPSVYVNILFGEKVETLEVKEVPVRYVAEPGFPYEVKIEPGQRTATVVVHGPRSVILGNPQIRDQILVFVKIDSSLKPSETPYLIERQHWLPEGVVLDRISVPDKVSVDILERKPPASGGP